MLSLDAAEPTDFILSIFKLKKRHDAKWLNSEL